MEIPEMCIRRSVRMARKRKTEEETDPDYSPGTETVKGKATAAAVNKITVTVEPKVPEVPRSTGENEENDGVVVPPPPPAPYYAVLPKKKPWEERRVIRRSKKLEEEESRPIVAINLIEREDYSIEDSKVRAKEARKKREALKKQMEMKMKPKLTKRMKAKPEGAKKKEKSLKGKDGGDDKNDSDDSDLDEEEKKEVFDYSKLKPIYGEADPVAHYLEKMALDSKNFSLDSLPNYVMGTGKGEMGGPPQYEHRSLWAYELMPLRVTDTMEDIMENLAWRKRDVISPDCVPEILSIVACFSIGRDLDLDLIANNSRNLEYNPNRFAPLIMRIRNPKTTALIFASGKIIVTGAKSEEFCKKAARKYARIIQNVGYPNVKVIGLTIQNISAHCNLRFKVRLNHLSRNKLYGCLSYEPELFPGLIIPLEYPRVKVIIFCTGSVLMTGAKSEKALHEAFKSVYPLVRMYSH